MRETFGIALFDAGFAHLLGIEVRGTTADSAGRFGDGVFL